MSVPPSGPIDARLMIVGVAPEENEVQLNVPFVGASGRMLSGALNELGYPRERCRVTNVCDEFVPSGVSLFSIDPGRLAQHVARLKREIEETKPNCILALGAEPLFFLTGKTGISDWRGSILPCTLVPGVKVVASFHPAWIMRGSWKWWVVCKHVDFKRAIEEAESSTLALPTRTALVGPSFRDAREYIAAAREHPLSIDIETAYWHPDKMGFIACVGLGNRPDEAMCIPFIDERQKSYWSEKEECLIWLELTRTLQHPIQKIAQNASFEWLYFWTHGIYPSNLWIDTMTLHHLLYPDFGGTVDEHKKKKKGGADPGHGLAFMTSQYTRSPYYKDDGKNWSIKLGGIRQWWQYNCMDVMVTFDIAEKMWKEAEGRGLQDFYVRRYIKPFYHALRAEWDGIPIDTELRDAARVESNARVVELQALINTAVGRELNVNSSKQLQELLYEERGYTPRFHKKTKKVTADKGALEALNAKHEDAVLGMVMELRALRDFVSDILMQKLDANNRTHTHYKLGGTDGARWSSTKSILGTGTNWQNIPRDGIARKLYLAG